jgi:hypothetical protein
MQHHGEGFYVTACALVFDFGNGALVAPIDFGGGHDVLVDEVALAAEAIGAACGSGAEVLRPELLVGEIAELVQAQPVARLLLVVVVDVGEVVLEDLEPALLLDQRVVHLRVALQPRVEGVQHRVIGMQLVRLHDRVRPPGLRLQRRKRHHENQPHRDSSSPPHLSLSLSLRSSHKVEKPRPHRPQAPDPSEREGNAL